MELEIFEALVSINIDKERAKAVANSIDAAIDKRYSIHARQLVTRGDLKEELADTKNELIRWMFGIAAGAATLIIAIVGALLK